MYSFADPKSSYGFRNSSPESDLPYYLRYSDFTSNLSSAQFSVQVNEKPSDETTPEPEIKELSATGEITPEPETKELPAIEPPSSESPFFDSSSFLP